MLLASMYYFSEENAREEISTDGKYLTLPYKGHNLGAVDYIQEGINGYTD